MQSQRTSTNEVRCPEPWACYEQGSGPAPEMVLREDVKL